MRSRFTYLVLSLMVTLFVSCSSKNGGSEKAELAKNIAQGQAALEKKDYDLAISCFTEALRLDAKNARAYAGRGEARGLLRRREEAIQDLSDAIRLDPSLIPAYESRAYNRAALGDYERAISDLNKVIEAQPENSHYYIDRGNWYKDLGHKDKALADYRRAAQLNPKAYGDAASSLK